MNNASDLRLFLRQLCGLAHRVHQSKKRATGFIGLLLRTLLQVAIATEHLAVIGCRVPAAAPRLDMVAVHLLELELFAANGALVALALVCLALRTLVERADGQYLLVARPGQVLIDAGLLLVRPRPPSARSRAPQAPSGQGRGAHGARYRTSPTGDPSSPCDTSGICPSPS